MLLGDNFRWKRWASLHLYLSYFGKVSPKAMMQTQEKTIQPYRLAIVLISCGLSSIAIGVSLMLLIHANHVFLLFATFFVAWMFILLFSWLALFVMGLRWAQDRQAHSLWPILGSIAGAISLLTLPESLLFAWPALILAVYLVGFHLRHSYLPIIIRAVKYLIYAAGLLPFVLALAAYIYAKVRGVM
jgi:hypothetical protein